MKEFFKSTLIFGLGLAGIAVGIGVILVLSWLATICPIAVIIIVLLGALLIFHFSRMQSL